MPPHASRSLIAALVAALLCGSGVAWAGLNEGLDALRRGDYTAAAKELRPLAERGDAEAQYRIGLMFEFGRGYKEDKAQGIAWLTKAANQGHSAAQQELGVIYTTGDGVPQDDAKAVAWFGKSAAQGNATAQFNLGVMTAKGAGVKEDIPKALEWFGKAAAQGFAPALSKLGIAYEEGTGVRQDRVLAYANYALAARGGTQEYVAQRDAIGAKLTADQRKAGEDAADAWKFGQPGVTSLAAAPTGSSGVRAAAPVKNRCSASGTMSGERFSLAHCAVAFLADQHSVAIWFNESPITPQEADEYAMSAYASGSKGGKERTIVQVGFCPGGGKAAASPTAVKKLDLNTNHAKSAMAGMQTVLEPLKDFKVEKLSGSVEPGGALSGRFVGKHGSSAWTIDFDVALPAKDAAAGLVCK
jgi:TPR repeat protein